MASVFEKSELYAIRRSSKRQTRIPHPSSTDEIDLTNISDLMRLPEYHHESFPYILARSKHGIQLVNLRTLHAYNLLHDFKPNFDNEFSAVTPNGKIDEGGSITIVFSSAK